jgi:hypothetical protein
MPGGRGPERCRPTVRTLLSPVLTAFSDSTVADVTLGSRPRSRRGFPDRSGHPDRRSSGRRESTPGRTAVRIRSALAWGGRRPSHRRDEAGRRSRSHRRDEDWPTGGAGPCRSSRRFITDMNGLLAHRPARAGDCAKPAGSGAWKEPPDCRRRGGRPGRNRAVRAPRQRWVSRQERKSTTSAEPAPALPVPSDSEVLRPGTSRPGADVAGLRAPHSPWPCSGSHRLPSGGPPTPAGSPPVSAQPPRHRWHGDTSVSNPSRAAATIATMRGNASAGVQVWAGWFTQSAAAREARRLG